MDDDSDLIPVFVPALAPLLLRAEDLKGQPLTEEEVIRIRDEASTVLMSPQKALELEARRGYEDLDPENCWEEWQHLREVLQSEEGDA